MNLFRKIGIRLRSLFRLGQRKSELEEEIQSHLDLRVEELIAQGATHADARCQARREFGHIDSAKEVTRDAWGVRWITDSFRDIRVAARSLRKSSGFSLAVIGTIAVCIGANATVFSTLSSLVLRPLPFADAQRVVHVFNGFEGVTFPHSRSSWNQYQDFKTQADRFESFALADPVTKIVDVQEWKGMRVTPDLFGLAGVAPHLGQFFPHDASESAAGEMVVLSLTAWEDDFRADPGVIGQTVRFLNESPYTIVGVAPRQMEAFDAQVRFFIPWTNRPQDLNPNRRRAGDGGGVDLWARLKPGVSQEQARAQLVAIERGAIARLGDTRGLAAFDQLTEPIALGRANPLQTHLVLLQGGALFVLLVGGVNVINLFLSRTDRRRHELSLRHSLGAGQGQLARLMVSESLLLTLLGTGVGWALSWGGIPIINRYLAALMPEAPPVSFDGVVLVTTLAIAGCIAFVIGVLPLQVLWRSGRIQRMDQGVRGAAGHGQTRWLRDGLIVSQMALTLALLVGAGLLFRSFHNVLQVDPGFDAPHLVTGRIDLRPTTPNRDEWLGIRQRLLASLKNLPGVEQVSFSTSGTGVIGEGLQTTPFLLRANSTQDGENAPRAVIKLVDSGFFDTMGIPIRMGRTFTPGQDDNGSIIVDQAFAGRYLQGQQILGTEMTTGVNPPPPGRDWTRIVGVVGRANFEGLAARDALPVIYKCRNLAASPVFDLLLRTTRPSENVILEVRAKLKQIHPELHLYGSTSLANSLSGLQLERRGITLFVGVFAGLALFLSSIGIYGVLAYDVQQRQREIGIRSALGATRRQVLDMILRQGFGKAILGLAIGIPAAAALSRYLKSLLFDVSALDPFTYVAVASGLLLVALAASFIPAQRATKVDPAITLRAE